MTDTFTKFSFLERGGFGHPESKIEWYWGKMSGAYSLNRKRTTQYSTNLGMTYSPLLFAPEAFSVDVSMPNDEWLADGLKAFVRGEMPNISDGNYIEPSIDLDGSKIVLTKLKANEIIFASEKLSDYQQDLNTSTEIAEAVYNLLCNNQIGSKSNKKNNDKPAFVERIKDSIDRQERLLFVIPGFPFKDQNRFRVPFDADTPDFAEVAFLKRLHNLASALYQIHPFGSDIVVLTDGKLYEDIFKIDKDDVERYKTRLLYYRNQLNIQGAVSIICLKDMIDRACENGEAWSLVEKIAERLQKLRCEDDLQETFNNLKKGMKRNINNRTLSLFDNLSNQQCWSVIMSDCRSDVSKVLQSIWDEFDRIAEEAAIKYAAVNLMLRHTDIIMKFFPGAIRATIHAKTGQFSLAGDSSTYSWNGIAWSEKFPQNITDIKVEKIVDLPSLSNGQQIKQVVFEHSNLPCFYTCGSPTKNIELARTVLPELWSINVGESVLTGHPFSKSDLASYCSVGVNDENYNWDRTVKPEDYYKDLFAFRQKHYSQYGFGVQGVWLGNDLVGQCGLQVLHEDTDELEIVIFLSKNYVNRGFGSGLIDYIISQCKSVGINSVFAVIRPENQSAIRLFTKKGWEILQTAMHYNHNATVYKKLLS
ncbi:MAG: L-tyrosine/L-tryptophan isonitrile synthase family protein [Oscillospiraceae bacterium]|jgi:pyoverdine/dityrosine biosynthesis protein Dit1/RimJ/RimL family protein N-acetyltransferase|nr:L-tyrosine/L-tryptophan isonitrile synthase family protein [Oscillospiraceae bacterium]